MVDQDIDKRRRKLGARGQNEKAASARRQSFGRGEAEKVAMAFDAENLLQALCKPWELAGHPHDFLVSHRSARRTDLYQHYERDKVLIQRHERLVAEKEAWKRQRELRADMLHLLTRLHSIEKERRRFIVAAMQQVKALDLFEEKLGNILVTKKEVPTVAPGSVASFMKKKEK